MDFEAICEALAARYEAATIGTPTGADAIRSAHGQAPHGPKPTPFVVVMPQDGEVIVGTGQAKGEHHIDVNFYLSKAPGDIPRVETQRQRWLPSLLSAAYGQVKLGLAPVVLKALPTGWEYAELPYGGDSFDGIIVHYTVWTEETVTLTP